MLCLSRRASVLLLLAGTVGACSSGGGGGGTPDGSDWPDGGPPIGWTPGTPEPKVTYCGGATKDDPVEDAPCTAEAGGAALLITGHVLTPGEIFHNGQVLVADTGTIACVGCDCAAEPAAAGASKVTCPDAVISPGLINAHDHITFIRNDPYDRTEERYEHRHDWRRGLRGHTSIPATGSTSDAQLAWGELRFVMGGATTINGSGTSDGFLRNIDKEADATAAGQGQVLYETFPLGDSSGALRASGCGYGDDLQRASDLDGVDAYTPHIAEGIDVEARNEFLCLRSGENDVIAEPTAVIHGTGLLAPDIAEMSLEGAALIWSPRTNVTLYGETARVQTYATLGVPIALGTDWIVTGSMNMLRELTCAAELNATYFNDYFTQEGLWLMATRDAAKALGVDDVLGTLEAQKIADITVVRGHGNYHRGLIQAAPGDVSLVLRGGRVLYGDDALVSALAPADGCDEVDVCGTAKRACVSREAGMSFADLSADVAGTYPLFFCEAPDNEPSCLPERNAEAPYPDPVRNGSTRYTGIVSESDMDGDGIADDDDNCIATFNPVRPVDEGVQQDFDRDGLGDECDPCPLDAAALECEPLDPNDRDGDGVPNDDDNCPVDQNPKQENADGDDFGDVCDFCPDAKNGDGAGCPATVYEIQRGERPVGSPVTLTAHVVTAVGPTGFFMQTETGSAEYDGAEQSGLFVYTGGAPTLERGDRVTVTLAYVNEYGGQKQLGSAEFTVGGAGTVPDPVEVTAAEIAPGGARAAALESVLVRVEDVSVTELSTQKEGEFTVSGGALVGSFLYVVDPAPAVGETFASITGVLGLRSGKPRLQPRDGADLAAGSPALIAFGPTPTFVRVNASPIAAIPDALTVTLSRAPASALNVTMVSSGAGLVVANVSVPGGSASATVPLRGVAASATPYTVTATLGGTQLEASVRVIGASESPDVESLTPAQGLVPKDGETTVTVLLEIPAPPGGTTVNLSATSGGSVPATVFVPANEREATFTFSAGANDATVTVTATGPNNSADVDITVTEGAGGSLLINEIDYDMTVNPDSLEFVELVNRSSTTVSLAGLALVLVNGSNGTEYDRVTLAGSLGAGQYLVIGSAGVTVAGGAMRVNEWTENGLQNGDPDGIALIEVASSAVLDAVSYGGALMTWPFAGISSADVATTLDDRGAESLCRKPNAQSTGIAMTDFQKCDSPSPGSAN